MKREGTIAATFLAIAAVVGFSLQTGPKPEESGRVDRSGEIKRSKPALTKSATKDMPGCSSLQSELQDFLDIRKLNFLDQCLAPSDPPVKQTQQDLTSKTSQLKFVIAILPDPVHTHLPVLFDRFAVAIQEAEFVCLNYLGFVQNVLGRLRTMSMTIMVLLVASTVAMSTYPFDPRQALSAVLIALCTIVGVVIVKAYADMHRDATLSHVTNTKARRVGTGILVQDCWIWLCSPWLDFSPGCSQELRILCFPGCSPEFHRSSKQTRSDERVGTGGENMLYVRKKLEY